MILNKDIHHPNDITNKYYLEVIPEKLKHYFKLPCKFVTNLPTKIYLRDGREREIDWLQLSELDGEEILILAEFQSYAVDVIKLK